MFDDPCDLLRNPRRETCRHEECMMPINQSHVAAVLQGICSSNFDSGGRDAISLQTNHAVPFHYLCNIIAEATRLRMGACDVASTRIIINDLT